MSKKQILLESIFEKKERLSDDTADYKTANKKNAIFNRNYQ